MDYVVGSRLPVFPTPGCPIIITLTGFCLGISPILLYSVDVILKFLQVDGGVAATQCVILLSRKKNYRKQENILIFTRSSRITPLGVNIF